MQKTVIFHQGLEIMGIGNYPEQDIPTQHPHIEVDKGYLKEGLPLELYLDGVETKVRVQETSIKFFEYDPGTGVITNLQVEIPTGFDTSGSNWVWIENGVSLKPLDEKHLYDSAQEKIGDNPNYHGIE